MKIKQVIDQWTSKPKAHETVVTLPDSPETEVTGEDFFYLDDTTRLCVKNIAQVINKPLWQCVAHNLNQRTALILTSGEKSLIAPLLSIVDDSCLFIRYSAGLPIISRDGLVMELVFTEAGISKRRFVIALLPISGGKQNNKWKSAELNLSWLTGKCGYISFSCQPGPENDPTADWLAVSDLCLARQDHLALCKAQSFQGLRTKNEIAHFSQAYKHQMYTSKQDKQTTSTKDNQRPIRKLEQTIPHQISTEKTHISDTLPLENEFPYEYANRLLNAHISSQPLNFPQRLKSRSEDGQTVRILSLCSGAARIESSFSSQVNNNIEWSLLDINRDLLQIAAQQFPLITTVDLIEADVNQLQASSEKWDIIMCVSALHHIVELERVIKFCHQSLNTNGEFWSIGECVSKNGNQLWPGAKAEINKLFKVLPEKYRLNANTKKIDPCIPENDYSVACFEGIRSEDIEPILNQWFHPESVQRNNCFLWRAIDLTYSDNYDLSNKEDRYWIQQLVKIELDYYRSGGLGTTLNGIYKPRPLS